MTALDNAIWAEAYRPHTIQDTILPAELKRDLMAIVEGGTMPNMLFAGTSGLGKTTAARALCDQLALDYILINASEDGGIETLRGRIRQFASTVSLQGGFKVVILDEADYLNAQSTQPALRGFMDEFSDNCRFIFTANFRNRIVDAVQSRCTVFEFSASRKEMASLAGQFMERLKPILAERSVKYDPKAVAEIIMKYMPDWRRVMNALQRAAQRGGGAINAGSLTSTDETAFGELIGFLKAKNFNKMRGWVASNMDLETSAILRGLYDRMTDTVESKSIPSLVITLADYQYKAAFVADHELNLVACFTEIMSGVTFK